MRVVCKTDTELTSALVAEPTGELDVHGATQFWGAVGDRLQGQTSSLLVDMSGVSFMSSAGIGTLVKLMARTEELGGKLVVFGCSDRVQEVLRITALEETLNACGSLDEARGHLR